jgi:hypothetical protein
MRTKKLLWAVISVVLIAIGVTNARADETVFYVSGTFQDGATLGGEVTIDTNGNGGVLSGDLTVTGLPAIDQITGDFANLVFNVNNGPNIWVASFQDQSGLGNNLYLDIDLGTATNLQGYTGGMLCSVDQSCGGPESTINPGSSGTVNETLIQGSLTPTPEPATAVLWLTGIVLVIVTRKRITTSPHRIFVILCAVCATTGKRKTGLLARNDVFAPVAVGSN